MKLCLFFLAASAAFGAIDGTVVNKTTGVPAANVSITLVKPGQGGMKTLGTTVSDASGHFAFANDQPGGGPQLLQAAFQGVNYNKLLTPATPTSGVELDVYAVSKTPGVAQVTQQFMVFEPDASKIAVGETVIFENSSTTTFNNEQTGSFRFYLPRAANGQVRVQVQGPQGMPLPRAAEKTETDDVFKISYPIKPGETQFEITYVVPAGTPFTYRGRVVPLKGLTMGPLRLIAPSGVTMTGADVQSVGTEPKTLATIYTVLKPDFSVDITGTGTLHPPEAETPDNDSPPVTTGDPQIYKHLPWLVGLALGILAVGLVVLYRTSPVRSPYGN
jgi:plastocyanin